MARAGVAWRTDLPVLRFCVLVMRDGEHWRAHSVSTGHVGESATEQGALKNLTRAIDAAIHIAKSFGQSVQEWFAQQDPNEPKYVRLFLDSLGDGDLTHTEETAPSGDFVLRATALKREAT